MFQTVRHWWGSGHGRITVRLFLFEFVVVMAGVFAAQGLQSWLAGRNDDREGRELISKLVAYGQNLDRVATY